MIHAILYKENPEIDLQVSRTSKEILTAMLAKNPEMRPSVDALLELPVMTELVN